MYHLLRLTVKDTTPEIVKSLLTQILVVNGPVKRKTIEQVEMNMYGGDKYDCDFDYDFYECLAPDLVKLPPGAKMELAYQEWE